MKKIGSGWTYNVYEYGEGKVLKKKKPFLAKVFRVITSDPRELFRINKTLKRLNLEDRNSFSIVYKLKETDFDFSTLANPVILSNDEYQQDFCTPVKMFLGKGNKIELLIEMYIQQIKYFWQYGFADTVYNFTINNGVDNKGNLVLIDFNEITNDKVEILESIKNKTWLKRHSFKFHMDRKQKEYFSKRMSEEVTEQKFNIFWKTR